MSAVWQYKAPKRGTSSVAHITSLAFRNSFWRTLIRLKRSLRVVYPNRRRRRRRGRGGRGTLPPPPQPPDQSRRREATARYERKLRKVRIRHNFKARNFSMQNGRGLTSPRSRSSPTSEASTSQQQQQHRSSSRNTDCERGRDGQQEVCRKLEKS